MSSRSEQSGSLVFKRALLGGKIQVRTECLPGSVTVLQDENGTDLAGYESFFYEKKSIERIQIEFNQKPIDLAAVIRIGFNDVIPAQVSIQDFLITSGYAEAEITGLIATYELDKVSYLPCAHLPIGPQRIVLLLAALKSSQPALVLRDPFMPFSGRWREHFAKLLVDNSRERSRVIVCTNLSFVPQTWSQGNLMNYLDVGHAAESMRAQYRLEQEAKAKEQEKTVRREEPVASVQPAVVNKVPEKLPEKSAQPTPDGENSTSSDFYINSAYREVRDRIFAPLKEFSDFMRSYSAIAIVGCMALLLATMGIAFSPDLGKYQEKMRMLANDPGAIFQALMSGITGDQPVEVDPAGTLNGQTEIALEYSLLTPEYETLLPTGVDELLANGETPLLNYLAESSLLEEEVNPSCS